MKNNNTIGIDLGNTKHTVCALDADGGILFRKEIANTPEALKPFFEENRGATVAMETGLCCRWVSALAKGCGCDAIVGNARKLAAIYEDKHKNDANDAEKIARLARFDRKLFHPVALRDDEHHLLMQILEFRDGEVRARDAGAYFGLTPAQDQSGASDAPKRITKAGNDMVRKLLVNCANRVLQKDARDTSLKRHGDKISARGGKIAKRKAKVVVARKIAVMMLSMLKSGREYDDALAGAPPAASPTSEPAA